MLQWSWNKVYSSSVNVSVFHSNIISADASVQSPGHVFPALFGVTYSKSQYSPASGARRSSDTQSAVCLHHYHNSQVEHHVTGHINVLDFISLPVGATRFGFPLCSCSTIPRFLRFVYEFHRVAVELPFHWYITTCQRPACSSCWCLQVFLDLSWVLFNSLVLKTLSSPWNGSICPFALCATNKVASYDKWTQNSKSFKYHTVCPYYEEDRTSGGDPC